MSDPKRATIITVGAPKSVQNNVNKTVRLNITLEESNELKCHELNYKKLVIAAARKKRVENGKTSGSGPFSDNDDDVAVLARKFEQKYGGKSTYGRKGRSKYEEFADIGAGYDESDSFIDNTHGYDEMIPPECDTLHGGFYINSGSLEFKTVPENQLNNSDAEQRRNNKRRISSSSSEEESSDSSSDSDSQDVKEPKAMANGNIDSHKTEHRKKKNDGNAKKKAKKVGRTDSSAATSGKQTSDENGGGDGESADSRTSQSDSLTSKPAPSSENVVTSDSSRDAESKVEVKLPQLVAQALEELELLSQQQKENPVKDFDAKTDQCVVKLQRALNKLMADNRVRRVAWCRAATALSCSRAKLLQRAKRLDAAMQGPPVQPTVPQTVQTNNTQSSTANSSSVITNSSSTKRKAEDDNNMDNMDDVSRLSPAEIETRIVETLQRLQVLIEEKKPDMIATYNLECERVQQERKKLQQQSADASAGAGAGVAERRLPKRRFPWCARSRGLLARLARLAGPAPAAAALLATRALPLFPPGFVRMPTLLRQASLNKEVKAANMKRQRIGSTSQPQQPMNNIQPFSEPIQFPSSLTVTTTTKTNDHEDYKTHYGTLLNTFSLNKELIIENSSDREKKDVPNNLGSITITPVVNKDKKIEKKEPLIRIKSPAALNNMVKKDDKKRKEKRQKIDTPLNIDTNTLKDSKSSRTHEFSKSQIDNMKAMENNLPHPALVPVHHSPTFAKPDKRPPEKKKKDVEIVSDMDPLGDIQQDPVAVDDSSSDIEVIEDKQCDKVCVTDTVPLDKSDRVNSVKKNDLDDETKTEINTLMRNLQEMQHSQSPTKVNCNSYGGVITSAQNELL